VMPATAPLGVRVKTVRQSLGAQAPLKTSAHIDVRVIPLFTT